TEHDFKDAGVTHLLKPSGAHVAVIFAGLLSLFALLISRRQAVLAAAIVATLYVACVGPQPSLLRALLVVWVGTGAFFLGRNSGSFQWLLIAAWGLSLWDPLIVFTAGFQMAFAACLAIIAALKKWPMRAPWKSALIMSVAAQLTLIPLAMIY